MGCRVRTYIVLAAVCCGWKLNLSDSMSPVLSQQVLCWDLGGALLCAMAISAVAVASPMSGVYPFSMTVRSVPDSTGCLLEGRVAVYVNL